VSDRPSRQRLPWAALVVALAAAVVCGTQFTNSGVAGFYHDDAIYAITARSTAAGRGPRLDGVPGSPLATKYPPLYPLALSAVWKVTGQFPGNLRLLKCVNVGALVATLVVCGLWLARAPELSAWERAAVLTLLATAPAFLSFSDVLLAEPMFMLFAIASLWAASARDHLRWTAMAAAFASLAFLTRSVGAGLVIAVIVTAGRRSLRSAITATAVAVTLCAPWLVWVWCTVRPANPLLDYYVRYESSAWQVLFTEPVLAWHVIGTNAWLLAAEASRVWGLGTSLMLATTVPLVVLGGWEWARRPSQSTPRWFLALYLLTVLGHPFPFARYLVPLTPFVMVALVTGSSAAVRRLGPIGWGPVVLVLAVHVAWVMHFAAVVPTGRHGELGREFPYRWEGFERTAAWIGAHTPSDAILASGHDQFYALYTERRAVRPWLHPVTLMSPAAQKRPTGPWLLHHLRQLGVNYLLVDPLLPGTDGQYGRDSIQSVLDAGGDHWRLVYQDTDYGHTIYEYVVHD